MHPTRANPHAHSHALPTTHSRLLVITTHHQIHEFDILAGKLTDWSRRNPSSLLPAEFRGIKDRVMGVVWDVKEQAERIWMYGSSWLGMLDLSQDFERGAVPSSETEDVDEEGEGADDGSNKKRKRLESERWGRLEESRKKVKGSAGAGNLVKDEERNGASGVVKKIEDGESMDLDIDALVKPEGDDEEELEEEEEQSMLGPLRRIDEDNDDENAESERRRWWCTYKYRPILGMVPIGVRKTSGTQTEEDNDPLEVVLVERPPWDLQQIQELGK